MRKEKTDAQDTHHFVSCRYCGEPIGVVYDSDPRLIRVYDGWHTEDDCRRHRGRHHE